jgi:hypothetical protein
MRVELQDFRFRFSNFRPTAARSSIRKDKIFGWSFFEENSQWVNSINDARRYMGDFFEDSAAGSVQSYVENFIEQLRSANTKLLKANESLSRIDESRLRLPT